MAGERRLLNYVTFMGLDTDSPSHKDTEFFDRFRNLDITGPGDRGGPIARTAGGCTLLNYVPTNQNPDGGSVDSYANTMSIMFAKYPNIKGNITYSVLNGDGTAGSSTINSGKQGTTPEVYQELWEGPPVVLVSRSTLEPVIGPPAFIFSAFGASEQQAVVGSNLDSITVSGDQTWVIGTDTENNVWFCTLSGSTVSVKYYNAGVISTVDTFTRTDSNNHYVGMALASGGGCYILEAGLSGSTKLYSASTASVSLVGTISHAGYEALTGISYASDGDIVAISYDSNPDLYGFKINPSDATVRTNYPAQIVAGGSVSGSFSGCIGPDDLNYFFFENSSFEAVCGRANFGTAGISSYLEVANIETESGAFDPISLSVVPVSSTAVVIIFDKNEGAGAGSVIFFNGTTTNYMEDQIPENIQSRNDVTSACAWWDSEFVYVTFTSSPNQEVGVARLSLTDGTYVSSAVLVSGASEPILSNGIRGGFADQDGYWLRNVVNG